MGALFLSVRGRPSVKDLAREPLYLNEFSFRHNNRENDDMFSAVVAGS